MTTEECFLLICQEVTSGLTELGVPENTPFSVMCRPNEGFYPVQYGYDTQWQFRLVYYFPDGRMAHKSVIIISDECPVDEWRDYGQELVMLEFMQKQKQKRGSR